MAAYYIDLSKAKSILHSRMPTFAGALRKSIEEWNSGLGSYHATFDEFARGVLINQLWYVYSSQALRSDAGVSLDKHSNGSYFTVDDGQVPGRGVRVRHPDCTAQAAADCVSGASCSASCFVVTPGDR